MFPIAISDDVAITARDAVTCLSVLMGATVLHMEVDQSGVDCFLSRANSILADSDIHLPDEAALLYSGELV